MLYFFPAIGIVSFIISLFFAFKKRHNMSKWIACVTIGIFVATFFMLLPTQWVKNGVSVENKALYSTISSLLYSFKVLGGRQDIAQLETIAFSGFLKSIYIYVNYIMFAVTPILASSLILSFIGDIGDKMRYMVSRGSKCYVFSEINNNSVAFAKSIKSKVKRNTVVFCNTKNSDKDLITEARKINAILLYKTVNSFKLSRRFRKYEFCFFADNEDENIKLTEYFISQKSKMRKHNVTVNAFAYNDVNIKLLESLMVKIPCAIFDNTHPMLIEKAKEIINKAPKTKIIFYNTDSEYVNNIDLGKDSDISVYEDNLLNVVVDDHFSTYDITLYQLNDEGSVCDTPLWFSNNRLVTQWQDEPLKIRFINDYSLFCNNLLYNHPLFDLPAERNEISVLLIGCGRLGINMLKTVIWNGQISGYTLNVCVFDKNAVNIEKEFYLQCPEMNNYDISFVNVDIEKAEFESALNKQSNTSFVFIATGSDDLNLSTAERVFRLLKSKYSGYIPPIFTRVRKTVKSENFSEKGTFLSDRNIHIFGSLDSVFSKETILNSQLEKLAFAIHLCCCDALDSDKDSYEYKKALYDFNFSEYTRRSSMATALHISAKLKYCGLITSKHISEKCFSPFNVDISSFDELMKNENLQLNLIKNEHIRWNAFMRSEGYRTVDFETVKKYAPITRSHKDEDAKLHPCIVDWEKLEELQNEYNKLQAKLNLKKSNFTKNDKEIVIKIPLIIKKAKQLCEED